MVENTGLSPWTTVPLFGFAVFEMCVSFTLELHLFGWLKKFAQGVVNGIRSKREGKLSLYQICQKSVALSATRCVTCDPFARCQFSKKKKPQKQRGQQPQKVGNNPSSIPDQNRTRVIFCTRRAVRNETLSWLTDHTFPPPKSICVYLAKICTCALARIKLLALCVQEK